MQRTENNSSSTLSRLEDSLWLENPLAGTLTTAGISGFMRYRRLNFDAFKSNQAGLAHYRA
jgi:hypothetical protein